MGVNLFHELLSSVPAAQRRLYDKQSQIAGQITHLLKVRKWKQRDLASSTGLRESYISRVLAGEANLTLETITKLEAAFDTDVIVIPMYSKVVKSSMPLSRADVSASARAYYGNTLPVHPSSDLTKWVLDKAPSGKSEQMFVFGNSKKSTNAYGQTA
jgi:transcriptional regulator with XRE-family HTH domain